MPHQCRNCLEVYPDNCKDILTGCNECGGAKFQYLRHKEDAEKPDETIEQPTETETVEEPETTPEPKTLTEDVTKIESTEQPEDKSQRQARKEVPDFNIFSGEPPKGATDETENNTDSSDNYIPTQPNMAAERDTSEVADILNSQFEGIKVVRAGEYEINLRKLFEEDIQVISLEQDGQYVVNIPKAYDKA